MSSERVMDNPFWFVIHTKPKQEERVDANLRAWGVETFNPRIKERRYNPYTGTPSHFIKSLFPRYIFARFVAGKLLYKVHYTRGLHSVVSSDGCPTPVDEEVIATIRSRVEEDGFVRIGEELEAGDRVVIKTGPFKSLAGIFERRMKGADRVSILLMTVNYQGRILIDREMVEKTTGHGA